MKRSSKNHLLDKAHRGFVYTCMGLTAYGCYLLGLRVHRYWTVIRPAKLEAELKMIQAGSSDNAPELRA